MRVENKRTYKGPGIYIGRPSKYGNPYRIDRFSHDRGSVIVLFEKYARAMLKRDRKWLDELRNAEVLICWCAPLACHGDVLVRLVEETS